MKQCPGSGPYHNGGGYLGLEGYRDVADALIDLSKCMFCRRKVALAARCFLCSTQDSNEVVLCAPPSFLAVTYPCYQCTYPQNQNVVRISVAQDTITEQSGGFFTLIHLQAFVRSLQSLRRVRRLNS